MAEKGKNTYQSLIEKIGENTIDEFMRFLQEQSEMFLQEASYKGSVVCNDRIMFHAILDYYSDIERLKQFHHIEDVRTNKVFAYIAYWILRRKPLQFINDDIEESDIFVNERFALFLVINECLLEGVNYALGADEQKKFDEYLDFLLYYFKYRECSPQALELLIETFKMGIEFQKTEQ